MRHVISLVALLGCTTLFGAQPNYTTIILTTSGTLGPVVNSGPDCFGLDGQSASVTATLQTDQEPFRSTNNTVTYEAPISGSVGPLSVSGIWTVTYTITKGYDAITFTGKGPMSSTIELTARIPPDTISLSVFKGPQPLPARFSPEPLSYPGTSLSYTALSCNSTQLALTGQIAGSTE
jgi:hypothetical protein